MFDYLPTFANIKCLKKKDLFLKSELLKYYNKRFLSFLLRKYKVKTDVAEHGSFRYIIAMYKVILKNNEISQ